MTAPRLLTIPQAAKELQASPNTVYRLISCGDLTAVDIGTARKARTRILARDLDLFIASRTRRISA